MKHWSKMRIIKAGLASGLEEIDTHWDFDEVMAAHELLDVIEDAEAAEYEKIRKARK